MSTLYLLTNMFPYGDVEPYLENEIKYYDKFEKVYIFALQIHKEQFAKKREVGSNITVIPVPKASNWIYILNVFPALTDKNLYRELRRLIVSGKFSKENLIKMFVYFSRSHYETRMINQMMKGNIDKNSIFYSYRFEYQPYVAVLLKRKWKLSSSIVSRAHRYDLYENVTKGQYIPMREYLLSVLDYVYPCSQNGTCYLVSKYPEFRQKVSTRYLGTKDYGIYQNSHKDECFYVVSCSNLIEVKRIHILVEALSKIEKKKIHWTHYGSGRLFDDICSLADEKLSGKIEFEFTGNLDNRILMQKYKENYYHIFVNVSASEGLPVSIMEAMSFGIPCIATDVGGTGEIVSNSNGVLLSANPTPVEVANAILKIVDMDDETYAELRKKARLDWEKNFNCEINYEGFTSELQGLASRSV